MNWQLVVHPDPEIVEQASAILRATLQGLGRTARPQEALHLDRARLYFVDEAPADCSIALVGIDAPPGARSPRDADGSAAREFIAHLIAAHPALPIVVLGAQDDPALSRLVRDQARVRIAEFGADFRQSLTAAIQDLHGQVREPARVDLHLRLAEDDKRLGSWRLCRRGGDAPTLADGGALVIKPKVLEKVLFESGQVEDALKLQQMTALPQDDKWHKALTYLSEDLGDLLFAGDPSNSACWRRFLEWRGDGAGSLAKAHIRVTVDGATHPLLIEALRDRESVSPADYWALHAPLFRHFDVPAKLRPLFKDADSRALPIHSLIVEADGSAGALPGVAELEALPHCRLEAEEIVGILRACGHRRHDEPDPAPAGGYYHHLRLEGKSGRQAQDAIREKLAERKWHLVHFCGHVVSADDQEPSIVLVPEAGGAMPIAALAAQSAATQLLFLSSCRSASTRAALHAVEQYLPAVLGFQWSIADSGARAFARAFYKALLTNGEASCKYLEYAFLRARRAVYEEGPNSPNWIAPVLVMQME